MFFVLVPVLFLITFYVLNNFFAQYKHTYRQLRASHGIHMKAAHTVLYMNKHTQTYASYPAMDISCMKTSVRRYDTTALGLLKKERKKEEEEGFFTSRGAYVKLRYMAILYTHSIGNQP